MQNYISSRPKHHRNAKKRVFTKFNDKMRIQVRLSSPCSFHKNPSIDFWHKLYKSHVEKNCTEAAKKQESSVPHKKQKKTLLVSLSSSTKEWLLGRSVLDLTCGEYRCMPPIHPRPVWGRLGALRGRCIRSAAKLDYVLFLSLDRHNDKG